jgi:NADH-quinone oxidoreductase subunit J
VSAAAVLAAGGGSSAGGTFTFWVLAIIAVVAALGMVASRRAVHCAVLLAVVMLVLAVLYATARAPFLAFVQVIVYTGAVLMLFLFVLMIVGVSAADSLRETIRGQRLAAGLAAIALFALLALTIGHAAIGPVGPVAGNYAVANVPRIATLIFTRYFFPFEVTSALLITAALGAMVLAHRERTRPRLTQREMSEMRVASGLPTPLPGPGTYARHNAVDIPALLPDGSPSTLSVSPVIARRSPARAVPGGPGTQVTGRPGGAVAEVLAPGADDGGDAADPGGQAGPDPGGEAGPDPRLDVGGEDERP